MADHPIGGSLEVTRAMYLFKKFERLQRQMELMGETQAFQEEKRKKSEELIDVLSHKMTALESRLGGSEARVESCEQDEAEKSSLDWMTKQVESKSEDCQQLSRANHLLRQDLTLQDETIRRLRNENESLVEKVRQLNSKISSLEINKILNNDQVNGGEHNNRPTRSISLDHEDGQKFSASNGGGHRRYSNSFLKSVLEEMKKKKQIIIDAPQSTHNIHEQDSFCSSFGAPYQLPAFGQSIIRWPKKKTILKGSETDEADNCQQEVLLNRAEKPWQPELLEDKQEALNSFLKMDNQHLIKVFRGFLNKVTQQNFENLIHRMSSFLIFDTNRELIDLIFHRLDEEPSYCSWYAKMCKVIEANDSAFFCHLLKKCLIEFETPDLYDGLNVEARKVDIENEPNLFKRSALSDELYKEMRLRRKKYLGTIKLMGELYNVGLIPPEIIRLCMKQLLQGANNENLECLCSLIETAGAKLAQESSKVFYEESIKDSLNNTLQVMKEFAKSDKTHELFELEKRIKYNIMDTIELSSRDWRPRLAGQEHCDNNSGH